MASITWNSLSAWTQQQVAALQAAATSLIDATTGSITLAFAQAVGGVALWLQAENAQTLAQTRFATSYGPNADSFGAQFSFPRLPAVAASSTVTLSRYTTTQPATIAAGTVQNGVLTGGAIVSTGPGGTQYMVIVDTTNSLWNVASGAYIIPSGTASGIVPIQALLTGSAGNVLANTITSFYTPIPGVDTITNPSALTNGRDAENDTAYKARFPLYLEGLESSDTAAIESAIIDTQVGIQYALFENLDYPGTATDNGSFFAVINDGSGSPPASLLALVNNAVNAERAFTVRFQGAYAPTLITPAIAITIRVASGFVASGVEAAVIAAIVTAVNATPLNQGWLYISTIEDAALSVAGCAAVQPGTTHINGANADLSLLPVDLPQIASSNVVVSTY